uniref:Uncharacterized protein n=1 Tax=Phytophthora ramorum TaxID=164328 RepID=H3HD86_PHYRM
MVSPPPPCRAGPAAPTLVLTNRPLFHLIMEFVDGVPGSIVTLVTDFQRLHQGVPWSATGALPRAAIQHGDLETLRGLRKLATTKTFQLRPELAMDGAARCAIQFGQLEILQYLAHTGLLFKLEIVQWVVANYPNSTLRDVKAEDLSRASVSVLSFLREKRLATGGFQDPRLVDLVATMGKMETLMFLLENEEGQCTSHALDGAAANGHLEIRTEGCTTSAMDGAARHGHREVVQFLHTQRTEGCTVAAMDGAARNGHVDMVKFLHVNRAEGCTTTAMDGAATGGFIDVVRFLHEHRSEGCTTKAMDGAARSGHLEVVEFLHEHRTEGCTSDAMD